jgi:hypothetical protein
MLDAGFDFEPMATFNKKEKFTEEQRRKWMVMYTELCAFKKEYGHCDVSYNDEENKALAKWVSLQQVTKGKGSMDEFRKKLLQKIGFKWNIRAK